MPRHSPKTATETENNLVHLPFTGSGYIHAPTQAPTATQSRWDIVAILPIALGLTLLAGFALGAFVVIKQPSQQQIRQLQQANQTLEQVKELVCR